MKVSDRTHLREVINLYSASAGDDMLDSVDSVRTEDVSETEDAGLAPGQLGRTDRGRLPEETRRVLVQLLRGPYVRQASHPKLWAALVRDEQPVRETLANLFLELVIDIELNLAFVRNAAFDDVEVPRVIRSMPLTLLDTALVLHLRQLLLRGSDSSGRVFIGRDDIDDALAVYRSATNTDPATFAKRINSAVEKMKKGSVLLTTSEPERFEVSPILAIVFDAAEVAAVTREVQALREDAVTRSTARYAAGAPERPDTDDADTDDADTDDADTDDGETPLEDLEAPERSHPAARRAAADELS